MNKSKSVFASLASGALLFAASAAMAWSAEEEKDFFVAATSNGAVQIVALDELLGKTPKTVFVPGRLYRNGQGALFINGQRFASPSGARDVLGFLTANGGFLIAVRADVTGFAEKAASAPAQPSAAAMFTEEELRKLPPEMRLKALQMMGTAPAGQDGAEVKFGNGKPNATVFYRCSATNSCTIARVVKGSPALQITDSTIWFNDPAQSQRTGREYIVDLLSYQGIDINGKVVDGPSGVLHAAPLPKGEWMLKRLDKVNSSDIEHSWVIRSSDGTERVLFSGQDSTMDSSSMVVPTSIVVDATPVSPSAAYGTISMVVGGYEKLYKESYIHTVPVCATSVSRNRVVGKLMNNTNDRSIGSMVAQQVAVIPVNGKIYAFAQAKIKGNVLGMTEVGCDNAAYPEKGIEKNIYASLSDSNFLGMGNLTPRTNGLAGFVHIKSPNGNVILLSERMKEGKPLPGIRVEDNKRIEVADAQRFLDRYAIVNE